MPPCWWRRPAPARPRACRWCCSTSRGRKDKKILVLEPRRLAARAAAARMAATLGEQVGDTVGLRVRFGSKISKRTRIEVVTEGVFTRLVLDDPSLDGIAAVLFDEFHERSLDADLGLALARDAQQGLREDLKILVMSATLDGARVAALLGDAPVVESQGRAFPVETRYLGRDPRAPHRAPGRRCGRARAARRHRLAAGVPAGRRRKSAAPRRCSRSASSEPNVDIVALLRRARCARAGPRHLAVAAGPPQGGAGDVDRGNLAHHRGRARRHRQRPGARAALRAGCRPDAARNRARVARRRRPAPRPRRPHRAGRLLPAVGRAADRLARALYAAGNSVGRSVVASCSIWRNGARPIRASSRSSIRRRRPRSTKRSALLAELGAIDAQGRITDEGRKLRALPLPPRLARMVVDAAAEGAGELAAADRRGAHRARARRRRSRSRASARSVPPRPLAPRRGCAGDGEAVGRYCVRAGEQAAAKRQSPGALARARLSRPHRQEPRRRAARSCWPTAAAARSIRPRRWRASRFSPWPN